MPNSFHFGSQWCAAFLEKRELDNSWNQLPLQTDFPSNSIRPRPIAKNLKDRFYTIWIRGAQIKTLGSIIWHIGHWWREMYLKKDHDCVFLSPISWEVRILGIVSCFLSEFLGFFASDSWKVRILGIESHICMNFCFFAWHGSYPGFCLLIFKLTSAHISWHQLKVISNCVKWQPCKTLL